MASEEKKKKFEFDKKNKVFTIFGKTVKLKTAVIIGAALIIIIAVFSACSHAAKMKNANKGENVVTVERRDITNMVTGSSVIEPNESYSITTIVTGEVTKDFISEGDTVKKGDKLYQIDAETAENSLKSAQNAVTKAQQAYNDAVKDKTLTGNTNDKSVQSARLAVQKAQQAYDDAVKAKSQNASTNDKNVKSAQNAVDKAQQAYDDAQRSAGDLSVTSEISGKIAKIYVSEGEMASGKIADVYTDNSMRIRLPFNEIDADGIYIGDTANLTIVGTGDVISGSVTDISGASIATDNHSKVKYVTIELENPGALTVSDKATAEISGTACNDAANFEYVNVWTITAKTSGIVKQVVKHENDSVSSGETVVKLESDSTNSNVKTAEISLNDAKLALEKAVIASDEYSQDSAITNARVSLNDANLALEKAVLASDSFSKDSAIKSAELSLSDAKLSLEKAEKTLEDYTITAPISGKVVTKNIKAGDKMDTTKTTTEPMCIIYDMSSMKFEISVDEVEVSAIQVGQKVNITADAIEGETFSGVVDNVSINGTSQNGVTTYPVTVVINDYGDLLPGMNIDAEIVVEKVSNVLAVPVSALNRGNIVYVKGDKQDKEDQAPDGYRSVEVKTGVSDDDYIEIKSGLSEGDSVRGQDLDTSSDVQKMMEERMNSGMSGSMSGGGGNPSGGGMNGGGGGAPAGR
jgi:HlyD family secretion protein